ncbi:MAG: hypothetical protein K0U64_09690 [Actinomycetia bacterium]|nr:hypothetical protein [Actinomycetes bacterium]
MRTESGLLRRLLTGGIGVVFVALAATACGVSVESNPRALPAVATQEIGSPTPVPTESTATRFVPLWFVREGELVPVDRRTDEAMGPQQKLDALEAGPTQVELDAGLRTAVNSVVPDVPLVITAEADGVPVAPSDPRQLPVVVSEEFGSLPSQEQLLVLGQVVITLTDSTDQSVLFVSDDGTPVGVPLPDGRLVNRPVTFVDYRELIAKNG